MPWLDPIFNVSTCGIYEDVFALFTNIDDPDLQASDDENGTTCVRLKPISDVNATRASSQRPIRLHGLGLRNTVPEPNRYRPGHNFRVASRRYELERGPNKQRAPPIETAPVYLSQPPKHPIIEPVPVSLISAQKVSQFAAAMEHEASSKNNAKPAYQSTNTWPAQRAYATMNDTVPQAFPNPYRPSHRRPVHQISAVPPLFQSQSSQACSSNLRGHPSGVWSNSSEVMAAPAQQTKRPTKRSHSQISDEPMTAHEMAHTYTPDPSPERPKKKIKAVQKPHVRAKIDQHYLRKYLDPLLQVTLIPQLSRQECLEEYLVGVMAADRKSVPATDEAADGYLQAADAEFREGFFRFERDLAETNRRLEEEAQEALVAKAERYGRARTGVMKSMNERIEESLEKKRRRSRQLRR